MLEQLGGTQLRAELRAELRSELRAELRTVRKGERSENSERQGRVTSLPVHTALPKLEKHDVTLFNEVILALLPDEAWKVREGYRVNIFNYMVTKYRWHGSSQV